MLLRCTGNTGRALPERYLDSSMGYFRETDFPLTVGRKYVPIGLTCFLGGVWYYVPDDDELWYPKWFPSPLFEIVDGRISTHWKAAQTGEGQDFTVYVAFPEWADDWGYYDRLTDRDEAAVRTYRRYRALLEAEHAL